MATQQDLNCIRGDKWQFQATFTLASGTISGSKLWLTIKQFVEDDDPGLVQIDTAVGGVVIDDGTHATFTLTPAQTAALPADSLHYDIQIRLPSGDVYTTQYGRFEVQADVTRASA